MVSGVRFQVSGRRNVKAETCWSEAEIPSAAKRQRGTLKPETLVVERSVPLLASKTFEPKGGGLL